MGGELNVNNPERESESLGSSPASYAPLGHAVPLNHKTLSSSSIGSEGSGEVREKRNKKKSKNKTNE